MKKEKTTEISFKTASSKQDFKLAEKLFKSYEKSLDFKIDFQGFQEELENINKIYAPPAGSIILAFHLDQPVGCIAVRKLEKEIGELKRMYVLPSYRKMNIGSKLLKLILEKSTELNYKKVRLDTLKRMNSAVKLYLSFGFYEIKSYRYNPMEDVLYMEKRIQKNE